MTESEFGKLVDETLETIEEAIDESNGQVEEEIDYDTAGGILTLYFLDHSQIIINRQTPVQQLWVAAKSGGFHYDYDGSNWVNGQTGKTVWEELSKFCSEQASREIVLSS